MRFQSFEPAALTRLGMPTGDADIRQLVIRFGALTSGTSRTYNGPRISRALMRATF